jgi:hypothetical protein
MPEDTCWLAYKITARAWTSSFSAKVFLVLGELRWR